MGVELLNGTACTRVFEHYPGNCTFQFGAATLAVGCLWRVIADGKVALTSRDQNLFCIQCLASFSVSFETYSLPGR